MYIKTSSVLFCYFLYIPRYASNEDTFASLSSKVGIKSNSKSSENLILGQGDQMSV
jgi:hypothetical protein